jgi:SAM-dependent methyltransferase
MTDRFALCERSKIIDFGCGPGLYTSRFAKLGAEVCGVDFSARSIAYAKEQAKQANNQISYIEADYLEYEPDGTFDLATMIMCDYSVLAIVLDVYSLRAFESKQEESVYGKDLMDGFWSPDPYFCFMTSFRYDDDKVSLDKYTIVERERVREVYNWFQYYSPESLKHEVSIAGLEVEALIGDVAGHSYDAAGMEFAVVLKAAPVFHQN